MKKKAARENRLKAREERQKKKNLTKVKKIDADENSEEGMFSVFY